MRAVLTLLGLVSAHSLRKPSDQSTPWLLDNELRAIRSVDCLKQLHAGEECAERVLRGKKHAGPRRGSWQIGQFPLYTDKDCGQLVNKSAEADTSHNTKEDVQPLCDPDGLLTGQEMHEIEAALFDEWTNTNVQCGVTGSGFPPEDVNFRIGVAILRSLAMPEQDPESLQLFADSVLQMWNLQGPELEARRDGVGNMCASSVVLVFVAEPDGRMALSSPNCDHICMDRGGDHVVTAAHLGMEKGIAAAVLAAIKETARVVRTQVPLDVEVNGTRPDGSDSWRKRRDALASWLGQEEHFAETQRVILFAVFAICFVIICATVYLALRDLVGRLWWDATKHYRPAYVDKSLRRTRVPLEL
jgi:hypothetical protein